MSSDTPTDAAEAQPKFTSSFWVANVLEIFERMAYYGFSIALSRYLTTPVGDGGLGLSDADRGVIQGVPSFFLYLFPAVFGALADRFGYKRMFIASTLVMGPSYLALPMADGFLSFLGVSMLLALGHGMFKPVVISTIVKSTSSQGKAIGFGIFYMMVNVGGWLGPLFAVTAQEEGWDWVFYASAAWIGCLALICIIFYKEPDHGDNSENANKTIPEVLQGMVAIVGNLRFFILVFGFLVIGVMGAKWWNAGLAVSVAFGWIILNLAWDFVLPKGDKADGTKRHWLGQRMRIGEGRFLLFLLLMSGFWTSFNQLFTTGPLFIRDYVDTSDMVPFIEPIFSAIGMNVVSDGALKPEFPTSLNFLFIVFFQVGVSTMLKRIKPLNTIIGGVLVTVVSMVLFAVGHSGWAVAFAVFIFSLGEMMASPKSKEYAGSIAPPGKVGTYMGYFYWSAALGHLFGGLLSGTLYGAYGPNGANTPGTMWLIFAALAVFSAVSLFFYDRWVRGDAEQAT